jgi:hypothetical protein
MRIVLVGELGKPKPHTQQRSVEHLAAGLADLKFGQYTKRNPRPTLRGLGAGHPGKGMDLPTN